MSRRDPTIAPRQMRDYATEAIEMVSDRHRRDLDGNRMLALALTRLVEVVGEAAARVPRDVQLQSPDIPWSDVVGMRHRLIHGYDEVDLTMLWETVRTDLPELIRQLDRLLARADSE
jgi:uncharacterized protein with HEPN domain